MKAFNLNLETTILRLYLMMLVIVIAGFTGIWSLAFLALPIFLSCLLGLDFSRKNIAARTTSLARGMQSRISHKGASSITVHD